MKAIRIALSAACAAILAAGLAHAGEGERLHTWSVEIGNDGRVVASQLQAGDRGGYADALERQLRGWHFQPGQSDDANANTRTFVRVVSQPQADGQPLVTSVGTGPAPQHLSLPDYPMSSQRMGEEGVVVLHLQLDADGRVQASEVQQIHGQVSRRMASSALAAAQDWRFRPEIVNGQPVAGAILFPVCFYFGDDPGNTCRWTGPKDAPMSGLQLVSLEPATRLMEPLASNH